MFDYVVNPEAVGDPGQEPIVRVSAETAAWLTDPAHGGCPDCNGINWFHTLDCPSPGARTGGES